MGMGPSMAKWGRLDRHWKRYCYHLEPLPTAWLKYSKDPNEVVEPAETVQQA